MEKSIVEILDKHIDQEALVKDLVAHFVLPKLEEIVAQSETKIDDAALAFIKKALLEM